MTDIIKIILVIIQAVLSLYQNQEEAAKQSIDANPPPAPVLFIEEAEPDAPAVSPSEESSTTTESADEEPDQQEPIWFSRRISEMC